MVYTMQNYFEQAKQVWKTESEALAHIREVITKETFNNVIDLLTNNNGRIFISGCGTSGMAAKKIAHTLTCVEKPASYLNPADAIHGGLGVLQKEDILILVSKGGNTEELLPLLEVAKKKAVTVVGVTENKSSAIGKHVNHLLNVSVPEEPDMFNMLATASTLAVIALFDAISIQLMETTGFTKEQFQIIHPGGAVGDRLSHDTN
ncbi:sugar isomerase [Lentibacillus kapialis]|uniref:Sugar isomerase n=1 Tax=Lentibacillus kapialis TaxID=340214 RepID=A0A917UYV8_9BACI|nr:SIS domain-containing protein [Lentibacillus kapialis]GGK00627.1 sugar isomerase [Lentibacillus kapialis]